MEQPTQTRNTGCAQATAIAALLLWLGAALLGAIFVAGNLDDLFPSNLGIPLLAAGLALLLLTPAVVIALLTHRLDGWKPAAAVAASVSAISGYLVLDTIIGTACSGDANLRGILRLVILCPYALLAAWLAPKLTGRPPQNLAKWLGLDRLVLSPFVLGIALAALVTLLWPYNGALGDRYTSLELIGQTLAWAIPQLLLFWGVLFALLTSTLSQSWLAGLLTILLYGIASLGGALPTGNWGKLSDVLLLFPLAILLTELRARGSGIYPLLPVVACYRAAPLLFTDPRDVLANLTPYPQHLLNYTLLAISAGLAGLALWGARRLLRMLFTEGNDFSGWVRLSAATVTAALLWTAWIGLFTVEGYPGFYDDGFLIIMEQQADLNAAYSIPGREDRLQYVYQTLVETAERTQAPVRAELEELGLPYRPYYIINMIRVDGNRLQMKRFEGYPGVAQVILNPNVRDYPHYTPLAYEGGGAPSSELQTNLEAIHADEAWDLGVTGEGIVVAGQDTGYDWTHPVLRPHYRGWDGETGTHDYNWHDAWDDEPVPFDDDSHGTHTMGTVLGDDGGRNRTGVAPGAQWVGCRNMRRGFGNPGAYAECMEYFLAPYPHGGDPFHDGNVRLAPHVINNSWGCPDFEGCSAGTLEPAVEALRAGGIMMVVSAGNDGPACVTATTPPANYDASFSIGAANSDGDITSFSSRGPVGDLIKPDVTAPGAYVRSSVPGGGYGYAGGTSMAGPHVAGLVALLWSADPDLLGDIDTTEALICRTARPIPVDNTCTPEDEVPDNPLSSFLSDSLCACGDVTGVPNNVYGCGFIDVGAAVREALNR
jgi:subtilisin family serine protease